MEKRIQHLEERVKLMLELCDYERHPFIYTMLEANSTKDQIDKVLDLMDEARSSLQSVKPMHHAEFERRVYVIIPQRKGDYHFAEDIIATLNKEGRYTDVYQHMKKSGMNI